MTNLLNRINLFLIATYIIIVLPLWAGMIQGKPVNLPVIHSISEHVAQQRQAVHEQSKMMLLNLLMPSGYGELTDILFSQRDPKSVDWDKYTGYYKQAASVLPPPMSADAHAMLGFCYYFQGKTKESLESYLQSIEQNPAFIWTYYNLAVIAFKSQDYGKVVFLTEALLKADPKVSMTILSSSKIYTDILRGSGRDMDLPGELKNTYSDAARMLVISLYRMGKFSEALAAAQSALEAGFGPAAVFNNYAGLANQALGDAAKANQFLESAGPVSQGLLTAEDLSVRFF